MFLLCTLATIPGFPSLHVGFSEVLQILFRWMVLVAFYHRNSRRSGHCTLCRTTLRCDQYLNRKTAVLEEQALRAGLLLAGLFWTNQSKTTALKELMIFFHSLYTL